MLPAVVLHQECVGDMWQKNQKNTPKQNKKPLIVPKSYVSKFSGKLELDTALWHFFLSAKCLYSPFQSHWNADVMCLNQLPTKIWSPFNECSYRYFSEKWARKSILLPSVYSFWIFDKKNRQNHMNRALPSVSQEG